MELVGQAGAGEGHKLAATSRQDIGLLRATQKKFSQGQASDTSINQCYAWHMTEFGLAILIIGALLITDRDRLEWVTGKARELMDWLSS